MMHSEHRGSAQLLARCVILSTSGGFKSFISVQFVSVWSLLIVNVSSFLFTTAPADRKGMSLITFPI